CPATGRLSRDNDRSAPGGASRQCLYWHDAVRGLLRNRTRVQAPQRSTTRIHGRIESRVFWLLAYAKAAQAWRLRNVARHKSLGDKRFRSAISGTACYDRDAEAFCVPEIARWHQAVSLKRHGTEARKCEAIAPA